MMILTSWCDISGEGNRLNEHLGSVQCSIGGRPSLAANLLLAWVTAHLNGSYYNVNSTSLRLCKKPPSGNTTKYFLCLGMNTWKKNGSFGVWPFQEGSHLWEVSLKVNQAGVPMISAGQDEEVIMHPAHHTKVGELEHLVHDPHHLNTDNNENDLDKSAEVVSFTLLQKPTLEEKIVMRSGTSAVDWNVKEISELFLDCDYSQYLVVGHHQKILLLELGGIIIQSLSHNNWKCNL